MNSSVTELPFNRLIGLTRSSTPETLLQLPAGEQYQNHLGTVHASALLALAEASSGEFLLRQLGEETEGGMIPVVRRMEAKFRKPAHGAVHSAVRVAPELVEKLKADLAGKGRALIDVPVELYDASGAHVLSATVEWFLQRMPSSAKPS